jgi:hypothetical protein
MSENMTAADNMMSENMTAADNMMSENMTAADNRTHNLPQLIIHDKIMQESINTRSFIYHDL